MRSPPSTASSEGRHEPGVPLVPAHLRRRPGIVGRGHSIPLVGATAGPPDYATGARAVTRPPDIDYLGQIARSAEQLGFTGVLTPTGTWCEDAWLTTAALISQTKRLKFLVAFRPGFVVPDPGRADGGDVPADVRRPAAAQRGHRRRGRRAAQVRRLPVATTSGTPGPASSSTSSAARGAASRTTSTGAHYKVEGATVMSPPDPVPTDLLRRLVAGGRAGRGQVRRRLPDLGRAARGGRGEDRLDARAGRQAGPDAAIRHPAAHDQPGHREGGLGRGRPDAG